MTDRPHAPGLEWRSRKDGRIPLWIAPVKARKAGYTPATLRLAAEPIVGAPSPAEYAALAATCRRMQAEALEFLSGKRQSSVPKFDGTLRSLVDVYQTHEASRYRLVSHATRRTYDDDLRKIRNAIGERRLDHITGEQILGWYTKFATPLKAGGPPRLRTAHGAMTMLRIVFGFGIVLGLTEARRLKGIMAELQFELPEHRDVVIEAGQVLAVRRAAHEMGLPSIALATAIMFECLLRQKDVIGEWIKDPSALPSGAIVDRGRIWRTGLVWGEHISHGLLLEKRTSKSKGRQKAVHDLNVMPMVVEELAHLPAESRVGPVILCELTGRPWRKRHFAEKWREIARAAGIPDHIWSMDARAGGITEGSDAGADLDHLRRAATHTNTTTTSRYNRNPLNKARQVAHLRVLSRG